MTGRLWRGGMVFGGLMLLWGLASRSGIPHFLLPSPLAVAEALWVNRAYLGWHTLITLSEILSGLALGVTLGVTLALGMILSPRLQRWLMPLVLTSQAIPVFALAPLLVLWLGFGMSAKVAMAVLVIFFPVTSAFFDGLRRVNQEYLDLARSMNASFGAQLRHVRPAGAGLGPAHGGGGGAHWRDHRRMGRLRRGAGLRHAQRQRATANRYLLRRAVYFSTTDPPAVAGGRYPATPADRLVAGIRMT